LNHTVILASSGDAAVLWRQHYPQLKMLELPENNISYGTNASWSTIWQSPRILRNISIENRLVQKFVIKNPVDLIVSDNRYGLYHPAIPAILITHQLQLLPPAKWSLLQKLWPYCWQHISSALFSPFREIW